MIINPLEVATGKLHGYMLGAIAPRPIAFASTINKDGVANLAPYSFFNAFGSNPSTLIFSPARRVRDNTIKHTLENIEWNKEVVINVVNYAMVQQMSLASCEYPKDISEFKKAGFTPVASHTISPFRVGESPVQIECKVRDIIYTGHEGGAGNLIVCEILLMHINDNILDKEGRIDANKIDLVARMGADTYCRASGPALFDVKKPNEKLAIGIDQLPDAIKNSNILTGNDLGMLANVEKIPMGYNGNMDNGDAHTRAKKYLQQGMVDEAWQELLK
jgi:flavin reductase (DIM6/NTAB) family NADH-FMN oxidoreductase RutF